MHSFRADLEQAAQDGSEWLFGAIATDLAAVPPEVRLQYLPSGVLQYNNIMDTNGCASRGPLNILETKLDYFYDHGMHPALQQWVNDQGYRVNGKFALCDAYIEILSGTTPTGNSLKAPLDAIRKQGVIPAHLIPLLDGMTWAQYMDPTRVTPAHRALGAEFLRRLTINYEIVYPAGFAAANDVDLLDTAVYAWPQPVDGIYPRIEGSFNHCVARIDNSIKAFDNYEPFVKQLATDYIFFDWAYSLSITAQNPYPDETVALFDVLKKNGLLAFFAEAVKRLLAAPVTTPPTIPPASPPPTPRPPHLSQIQPWALAIQHQEGGRPQDRNTTNRNPGNLKATPYTKSLGATGFDEGNFCIFPDYQTGFKALCTFLTDAASGRLISYKPDMTLDAFTTVYAQPPNANYVNGVANALGVHITIAIKELL